MSCYCSASHTDNNYSTDEHDSVRDSSNRIQAASLSQKFGLHQSDSGADLSEYYDYNDAKTSLQNLFASYGKTLSSEDADEGEKFFDNNKMELEEAQEEEEEEKKKKKNKNKNSINNNVGRLKNNEENDDDDDNGEYKIMENPVTELKECQNTIKLTKEDIKSKNLWIDSYKKEDTKIDINDIYSDLCKSDMLFDDILEDVKYVSNDEICSLKGLKINDQSRILSVINHDSSKCKGELERMWIKFWSENGEQLIWTSWIEKYAAYINPGYFDDNQITTEYDKKDENEGINNKQKYRENYPEQNTCFPNQAHKDCEINRSNFEGIFSKNIETQSKFLNESTNFPFQESTAATSAATSNCGKIFLVNESEADDNRKKLINREISPEIGEGWNPLSPFSIEESYNQPSNMEDEQLITISRCSSISESIANTNATTDSMTDVTKMTINSSSFDSNSIHSSSLFSSTTSSIESNVTSSSSELECEPGLEDVDKYWQKLWKEHFQEQYCLQCKLFMERYDQELELHIDEFKDDKEKYDGEEILSKDNFNLEYHRTDDSGLLKFDKSKEFNDESKDLKKEIKIDSKGDHLRRKRKMIMESVGMLMQNLTVESKESHRPMDSDSIDNNDDKNNSEKDITNSYGTPTASDSSTIQSSIDGNRLKMISSGGDGDRPNDDKPITLKRWYKYLNIIKIVILIMKIIYKKGLVATNKFVYFSF